MPKITTQLRCNVSHSFRTAKVGGLVDYDPPAEMTLDLAAHVPPISGRGSDWKIGAIIGPSGDGKSTIGRAAYGDDFIEGFDWPAEASILDGFPGDLESGQIINALTASGFSTVPAWFQPYQTLSNGQRFRADLARALLLDRDVVAVDEFGGTVDEAVASATAAAVARSIRAGKFRARRFVAVGARSEFVEWLQPDWVLNMASRTLVRGWVRRERTRCPQWFAGRPPIRLDVRRCDYGRGGAPRRPGVESAARRLWPLFAKHHYLSGKLHPAAWCYVALLNGQPVGFCATLNTAGHVGRRSITRLVVMPDFQGLGIGSRLLDAIAAVESSRYRLAIRTSHPALIGLLKRGGRCGAWVCTDVQRNGSRQVGFVDSDQWQRAGSVGRSVVTFSFRPQSA